MNKKLVILVLTVLIIFLLIGCSDVETSNNLEVELSDNEGVTKVNGVSEENIVDTSKDGIREIVNNDNKIDEIVWSNDEEKVCFTRINESMEYELFIWKVGQAEEKQVAGIIGNLYDISWSPNNKYVTLNEGTSVLYETFIILVNDMEVLDKVVCTGGPIWSMDSNSILFAILNDKKPTVDLELDGTTDLMVYDLNLMRKEIILEASNDYMYNPVSWDEEGIKYKKEYFDGSETETFIYGKNDLGIGQYQINTEEYNVDENQLLVEIKYPQITDSSNKEIEDKVNAIINARVEEYKNMFYQDEEQKQYIYVNYEITKKDQDVLSMIFNISFSIEGVAHPSNFIYGVTINLHNGEEIKLTDLFRSNVDSVGMLNVILNEKISNLNYQLNSEFRGIEDGQGFYLTEDSLVIYYQEGIYTPHAVGALVLKIPNTEIEDIFNN